MAIVRSFSGDGLPSGPITTSTAGVSDTAWNIVSGDWSTDTSQGARPPAIKLVKVSGVVPNIQWTALGNLSNSAGRVYVRLSSAPSGTVVFLSSMDNAAGRIFDLALLSTARLRLHDSANAQVGSLPVMDLDTWYRVEWTQTSTEVSVHLYAGESTTALGTVTWNGAPAPIDRFRIALNSSSVTISDLWVDDVALSDQATLIGPAGTDTLASPFLTWNGAEYVQCDAFSWNGSGYIPATSITP